MIDSSLEYYQGKLLKKKTKTKKNKKKTQLERSSFLRAKALQGCQIQIKVIV